MEEGAFDVVAARAAALATDGCEGADGYRSVDRPEHAVLITHWRDPAALEGYQTAGPRFWDFAPVD